MAHKKDASISVDANWVKGELCLAGMLDKRMIELLQAIDRTGSINQAAKQVGLSYKGAWQIIERANNGAPKTLVSTATGGAKGGGTCLTDSGHALVSLFLQLERQHQEFLAGLNHDLSTDPDTLLLLYRLVVKTSARNQLFGHILAIQPGAVNAEVAVKLKGGEQITVTISLKAIESMNLSVGADALLLINSADMILTADEDQRQFVAKNHLRCRVLRVQQDNVNAEVMVQLPGGEILAISVTPLSVNAMTIETGQDLWAIFNSNAPILGVRS
ncbi:MAG: TOBE domain-containing protein [Methylomonas sp.]|nr:TOBE domain-containing protein [Methylomonas sp.]